MITHVAIIRDGIVYELPKPNRHHHVFLTMPKKEDDGKDIEGFVDNTGKFLTRKEAYIIAKETGQLNRRKGPGMYDGDLLFSEDLW